jgi:hypothetical protein
MSILFVSTRFPAFCFNSDFRAVPHEALFGPLSSCENSKSYDYNYLADDRVTDPYMR